MRGFEVAYHLVDEESGESISISVFDSETAARSAEEQVGAARLRLDKEASAPDSVHVWRVVDQTHP